MNNQCDLICQSCGVQLNAEQNFCHNCGSEVVKPTEPQPLFCSACGVELCEGQNFCPNCGTAVMKKQPLQTRITQPKKIRQPRTNRKSFVLNLIRSSLVLALAIFLLVAAFVPMVKMEIDADGEKVNLQFNAVDGIAMPISSFFSENEKDTLKEITEIAEDMEEYEDEWADGEELNQFARFAKKMIHVMFRSESVGTTGGMILAMILSVAQIVLAILLVIFATLSFVAVFCQGIKISVRLPLVLSGLTALVMFANAFALKLVFNVDFSILDIVAATSFTATQIWAAVLTLVLMLVFFVLRIVDKDKIRVGTMVKHGLSLVFAFVLFASVFAPIVSTEMKTSFSSNKAGQQRATSTLDGSLFECFSLSEDTKKDMDKLSSKQLNAQTNDTVKMEVLWIEEYSAREFEKGEADPINKLLYSSLLLGYGAYEFSDLFALGSVLMILVLLFALVMIWKNMYELATGSRIGFGISVTVKILAILMAALIVALAIVMSVIVTNNAQNLPYAADELKPVYKSMIAYGPILMLVAAVGMASVPSAISKRSRSKIPMTTVFVAQASEEENKEELVSEQI